MSVDKDVPSPCMTVEVFATALCDKFGDRALSIARKQAEQGGASEAIWVAIAAHIVAASTPGPR